MSRLPFYLLGRHFVPTLNSGRTAITDATSRLLRAPSDASGTERIHQHADDVLELHAVLASIATRAGSAPGRERILALGPHARIDTAREAQGLCADLLACHAAGDAPPKAAPPELKIELERLRH